MRCKTQPSQQQQLSRKWRSSKGIQEHELRHTVMRCTARAHVAMSILSANSLRFSGLPFRCDSRMLRSLPKSCRTEGFGSENDGQPCDAMNDSQCAKTPIHCCWSWA